MGKIKKILENELVGGTQSTDVYPVTSVKAVYDENNERLDHILNRRGVVNISTNYNDDHTAEVLTLAQAIAKVPSSDRVLGFIGRFYSSNGWETYSFNGESLTEWSDTSKWSLVSDSSNIKNELGNSIKNPITQEAASRALLYSMPFTGGWVKDSGTEFEGIIPQCLTQINAPKSIYADMGEGKPTSSYTTYYHTNNNGNNTAEQYIYADFSGIGTYVYRSVAIFNSEDELIYQGRHYGKCLFKLPPTYTIYISGEHFNTIPRYSVSILDRDAYIEKAVIDGLISSGVVGYSEEKVLSQAAAFYLDKHFISTGFIPPYGVDSFGTPVGTLIDHYVPSEFSELEDFESAESPTSPIYNFKTYVYTNNETSLKYVYAKFHNNAQYSTQYGKYMKCGLYDSNNALIRTSVQDGSLLFAVLPGFTLVMSGEVFEQVPVVVPKGTVNNSSIQDYVQDYVQDKKLSNFLYKESVEEGGSPQVSWEQDSFIFKLSWGENTTISNYSYVLNSGISVVYRKDAQYRFRIKNTGSSTISVGVGVTRGSEDWIKGYFVSTLVEIKSGETSNITLSQANGFNSPPEEGTIVHLHLVLKGNLGANAFAGGAGSLELEFGWSENAVNAVNAENAVNAGWVIGGISSNAVLRDSPPSGGVTGAMTLQEVDNRTVHISTNINSDVVGSRYRGIYWRINYKNFEDIKGIWKLSNEYSGYSDVRIQPYIQDWGPTTRDNFVISKPTNGGVEWDLYDLIMNFKSQQEEKGDESKWTGILTTHGYFYIQIIRYSSTGLVESFEDTLTLDRIPLNSKVIATEFSSQAEELIKDLIENQGTQKIQVTNWGDSLTAGAGSSNHTNQEAVIEAIKSKGYPDLALTSQSNITYSIMMQELLGNKYNVTNCGVGGESLNTIAARLGANLVYAKNDFVLPADTTSVQIGAYNGKLDSSWGVVVAPLLQGAGNSVNPCYVQGVECTLKWTGSRYSDTEGTYTLQRVEAGDRAVSLPAKTPIILSGSKLYRDTKLAVLWCWQNGGYTDNAELIEKLDKMIAHLKTPNYVIVGLHSGTESSRQEQEDMLTSKYGDKFFNWRQYISTNALYDFGISPSEEDLTAMESGSTPPSLLIDSVHLCAAGYAILGFKIIERFKNLGYIS